MPKARLFGLSAVSAAAMMAFAIPAFAQVKELHVMDAGGQWGDAVAKCVDEPLLKEKGIKVITETPGGYAKLAAQAKSGVINNVSTDGSTSELSRMAAEGLIEEIDWAAIDPKPMFDEAKNKYGFGSSYYHGLAEGRSGAGKLGRILRYREISGQASPAGLSRLCPALRSNRRRHDAGGGEQGYRSGSRL